MASGWYNEPRRHSLAARGVRTAVDDPIKRTLKVAEQLAEKEEQAKEQKMIGEVETFLKQMCKSADSDCLYTIRKEEDGRISLSTDGFLYTDLYDPSTSEIPYLMREAEIEFGAKMPPYDPYKYQERFAAILKKHGYSYEPYGQGIITIYKE